MYCPFVLIRLGTTKKGIGPTYASKVCTSNSYHRNFCIYSLVFSLYFSVISFFFYCPFQAQRIGLRICDLVGDFNVFEQKWVIYCKDVDRGRQTFLFSGVYNVAVLFWVSRVCTKALWGSTIKIIIVSNMTALVLICSGLPVDGFHWRPGTLLSPKMLPESWVQFPEERLVH